MWRSQLGKLKVFSGKEICQILQRHEFQEVRRKGSHVIMQKKIPGGTITVPVPDHKIKRKRERRSFQVSISFVSA
jgi:predicted RNA binding protein YcfA (HicA-like mRNA interferase family)